MSDTPPILDYDKALRPRLAWASSELVLVLALLCIPIELGCAGLAYYTIGEVVSGMYFTLVLINVFPVVAIFASRRFAVIGLLVIAMLIIPYQLFLGVRWWRVHREAERIVVHLQSGAPGSTYIFRDSGTRPFINIRAPAGKPDVDYWIGTPSTSHWYDPAMGWCYYAD